MASDPELTLRLRAEELITGWASMPAEEAYHALIDVETAALALSGAGVIGGAVASALFVEVVDGLAARGVAWVEPVAVDLELWRLYRLGSEAARPRLRRVVPVATTLGSATVTSVDLWDDHAEVRVTGGEEAGLADVVVLSVAPDEERLHVRDRHGNTIGIDLDVGREGSVAVEKRVRVDHVRYVERTLWQARASALRDLAIDNLNAQRRRVAVAAEALGVDGVVERFDAAVSTSSEGDAAAPALREVVPIALRTRRGWVLSLESWSDHWQLVVRDDVPRGSWTAVDDHGGTYGGAWDGTTAVRFDPALGDSWASLTLAWVADHECEAIEFEVER